MLDGNRDRTILLGQNGPRCWIPTHHNQIYVHGTRWRQALGPAPPLFLSLLDFEEREQKAPASRIPVHYHPLQSQRGLPSQGSRSRLPGDTPGDSPGLPLAQRRPRPGSRGRRVFVKRPYPSASWGACFCTSSQEGSHPSATKDTPRLPIASGAPGSWPWPPCTDPAASFRLP